MSLDWEQISAPPAEMAVFQILPASQDQLWLATSAGLLRTDGRHPKDAGDWRILSQNPYFTQPGALFISAKMVLAAGLDVQQAIRAVGQSNIFRSSNLGASWQVARVDQPTFSVSNFGASPNFGQDGVILAGTGETGMLRSRDGGRTWQLSNFGLRNFSISCLLVDDNWARREPVFAGTEDGCYFSPNGGRAWKFSGLEGQIVLSLGQIQTRAAGFSVYAGLENEGLFRLTDGARTWEKVDLGVSGDLTINAIGVGQNGDILLGIGEVGLIRSTDGGVKWDLVENSPSLVISLAEWHGRFYAGTAEDGLWVSDPGGPEELSWQRVV